MSDQQLKLIRRAVDKHGSILPCGERRDLEECFTLDSGRMVFWYNSNDNSTHVEVESQS